MSEERLERIENQLERVIQGMTTMNTQIGRLESQMGGLENRMGGLENRMGGLENRIGGLENRIDNIDLRIDSLEGTLLTTMTEGFNSLHNYQVDLDYDLAINEQKTEDNARKSRRLNQRLMRLEYRYDEF